MLLRVTGTERWAVQGIVQALVRAGARAEGAEPEALSEVSADADVLLVVQASQALVQRVLAQVPATLPLLWIGGSAPAAAPGLRPSGVLAADTDDQRLLAAAQALAAGLHVSDARAPLQPAHTVPPDMPGEPLTPRELEVFELLAKGLANREIAQALEISSHTAKFHVAQILEKTGAATRTEAVRQGLRLGWIGL